MHALYLLDPEPSAAWAPFAGVRPLAELRAGAHLVRERWEIFVGREATEVLALPHLAGFVEPGVPPVAARHPITGPAIIGSATFAPRGLAPALPAGAFR
ncbi:MAG: putative sugar nucleotidyl transferase, partial [Gemmatimonadales bacterium]